MITFSAFLDSDRELLLWVDGRTNLNLNPETYDKFMATCQELANNIKVIEQTGYKDIGMKLSAIAIKTHEPIPPIDYIRFNNKDYSLMDYDLIVRKTLETKAKHKALKNKSIDITNAEG